MGLLNWGGIRHLSAKIGVSASDSSNLERTRPDERRRIAPTMRNDLD